MAFVTISHWTATEMSNELMETAKNKFMPMIMSVGAITNYHYWAINISIS